MCKLRRVKYTISIFVLSFILVSIFLLSGCDSFKHGTKYYQYMYDSETMSFYKTPGYIMFESEHRYYETMDGSDIKFHGTYNISQDKSFLFMQYDISTAKFIKSDLKNKLLSNIGSDPDGKKTEAVHKFIASLKDSYSVNISDKYLFKDDYVLAGRVGYSIEENLETIDGVYSVRVPSTENASKITKENAVYLTKNRIYIQPDANTVEFSKLAGSYQTINNDVIELNFFKDNSTESLAKQRYFMGIVKLSLSVQDDIYKNLLAGGMTNLNKPELTKKVRVLLSSFYYKD